MSTAHPRPEPYVYVLFGATGDLAKRKLLPGLYHLFVAGLLPEKFRIIGTSPRQFEWSDDDFAGHAKAAIDQFGNTKATGASWDEFASRLSFGAASPDDPSPLVSAVEAAESAIGGNGHVGRLFHLAVPPSAFISVIDMLGACGLPTPIRSGSSTAT
jgi:glucose-6-phosphate 1-dehydrogenase